MGNQVHTYQQGGLNLALDVNTGILHILDAPALAVANYLQENPEASREDAMSSLFKSFPMTQLTEAWEEIAELKRNDQIFADSVEVPDLFAEEPILKSLCLHVAHDCNLRCEYCFAATGNFGGGRSLMDTETGKKAIDFLIQKSGTRRHLELDYFGGEPLMNLPVVIELTAYVKEQAKIHNKEFKLTLTTNGVLLTEEAQKFLNEEEISLVLSLDGRKEVHDKMRPNVGGQGSYETVVERFKEVIAGRPEKKDYYLRGTFTAWNKDFSKDVLHMADIGFTELSVEPVVTQDERLAFTEADLPQLFSEYDLLAEEFLKRHDEGRPFLFFHFLQEMYKGPCMQKRLSGCGAGHEYAAVTPEGDLYPCHQFVGREEYKMGNLDEGILKPELPEEFRNTHVLTKEGCIDCWARFHCSGGCHANAEQFNGDIKKPYKLACDLQKKRIECALYIQAQLALKEQK